MGVLVTEHWSDPQPLQFNPGGGRATRVFDVTGVSDGAAAVGAVVNAYPDTAHNAAHPLSPWLYVEGKTPVPMGVHGYVVTVTYSTTPAGRHADPSNPLNEPVAYHWEWQNTTEGCDRDAYGNVIQGTSGQSFSSLVPTDVMGGILTAERNEPYYDAGRAVQFGNNVNSAVLRVGPQGCWVFEKGRACCRRIVPLTPITEKALFVRVQYTIEVRFGYKLDSDGYWDGFKVRIENVSTQGWYNNGGTATRGQIVQMMDGKWQCVPSPVRLDATGKPVDPAYKISMVASPYAATPVSNPKSLPATTIIENGGDAYFVKYFPQTIRLSDLNNLGI